MSLSAVSAFVVLATTLGAGQALAPDESRTWTKVRPSVVTLYQAATPVGVGVCVDKRGYFLAHRSSVPATMLFGRLSSGPQIEMRQIALDEATQLVLLASPTIASSQVLTPVALGAEPEKAGSPLLAVFPSGPARAEFVSGEKLGVMRPSQRLFPLNELRFESASAQIGGGLVFNLEGALIGVLGATLGSADTRDFQSRAVNQSLPASRGALGGAGAAPPGGLRPTIVPPVQFGPAPQTVAYSVSSSVLQRVVSGLTSPSRKVVHPAIGVFCKDGSEPGAEIVSIASGSPAERAGLRIGDVIVAIGESPVKTQVDVGRITMRHRIGAVIEVRIKRAGREMTVQVGIGAD